MLFEHTSLAATASALVDAIRLYGGDADALFRRAGVDIDAIRRPGARYSYAEVQRLWKEVRDEAGDPAIGVAIGQHMRPSALHSLGLSWISSPTVLDGLQRFQRYAKLTSTLLRVEISETGKQLRYAIRESDGQTSFAPEGVDTVLSAVVGFCRMMTNRHFVPQGVALERPDNGRIDRYIEYFQCPIRFAAGENALYFDAAEIAQPAPAGNREIAFANDRITEQYLASLDPELLQDKVRELLVSMLPSGHVSQREIARYLHRSVSALQRQLKAEGVSFRTLFDETRAELAQRLVSDREYTLAEITYLLGFADQANFSRAFKRWHGDTPSVYRNRTHPSAARPPESDYA